MKRQQRNDSGKAAKTGDSATSLHEAGLRHFNAGRFGIAEERVRRALAADAQHPDSLHLAGLLHAQANRIDLAIDFVGRAIRIDQANPDYLSSLGALLARLGRLDEAVQAQDLALKLRPDSANLWVGLGDLLKAQRRYQEALLAWDRALSLDPRHLGAADKSGALLIELQNYAEALARFEQSDVIRPGRSETLFRKGLCLQSLSRLPEAVASYTMALAANAGNYDARNNLGGALFALGRLEDAAAQFRKAIKLKPDGAAAFSNLGFALFKLRRFDEALAALNRAIALTPTLVEAISLKADALKALGRPEEALADYDRAIALKPNGALAYAGRARCLDELMRPDEALSYHKTALTLAPGDAETHWHFAANRLRAGDFETGWREAEWRWKAPALGLKPRPWQQPLWLGEVPIEGKTLLLHNDQGLGDAIQFCRYIPLLAGRGARVILEIDRPLASLLSKVEGIAQWVVKGETLPAHDFHCPLASLPLAFGTTLRSIPARVPYLSTGEDGASWDSWLGQHDRPRIGLVWSGNPDHWNDHNRSIALKSLLPLLQTGARFVSLQKNARDDDLAILGEHRDILDAAPRLVNFADTAALVQRLDLVISVDTSVAHLAGAMGRPTWILLPYVPDYRWLLDRDDSPWYPTVRLFRQTASRSFTDVLDRVRGELIEFISAGSGS